MSGVGARTELYLVRHGEQEPSGDGLSAAGREQAERLGRRLRGTPFSRIHHSPLPRAAQTADILAGHLPDVPRHVCDLVVDRTPVPGPEHDALYPPEYRAWLDRVPAAERDPDAAHLETAIARLGEVTAEDRHELLVTHNFVIGWFVRHVLDAPVWRWIELDHANCGLTVLRFETGPPPTLVAFNDTGHL